MKEDDDSHSGAEMDDFGTYAAHELSHDADEALSAIEPLSSRSLDALARLARYKPPPDPCRAAVLVCLFGSRSGDNLNVLLSTRSATLRTYPGQVALPGGKMDDTDLNLEATARREAYEEVGIPIDTTRIRYLTALPPFLARSMMLVTPIVCFVLDYSLKPELNPSEVDDLFSFPLEAFLTSSPSHPVFHHPHPPAVQEGRIPYHSTEDYGWYEGRKHRFHSFEADPQAITGLTAEILIHVAMIAYNRQPDFELYSPSQLPHDALIRLAMRDPKWHKFRQRWRERKEAEEKGSKL
ncbi:hypothetical protein Rhopal_004173-T1 [Rhodotorula paludigena]|uniref:Nudix hydrolase domain-containing protein n=1 Tax=Rhodotorula paludigena TaxID=86838 RepID=A0AAV5GNR0_9BASI|nr:hypothetical protein Rhopal_004173-T1 [Rhodotorula paludigena]